MAIQKVVTEVYGPDKAYCLVQRFLNDGAVRYDYFETAGLPKPQLIEVRPMVGLLGNYFLISRDGKVFSIRSKKRMATAFTTGYEAFTTKLEGRSSKSMLIKVHQAVARAFIDNPLMLPIINHKDGIKTNNLWSNLEWCTHSQNTQHAIDTGLMVSPTGLSHGNSKVNGETVTEVRYLKLQRKSNRAIGRMLNLHHTTVGLILDGSHYAA